MRTSSNFLEYFSSKSLATPGLTVAHLSHFLRVPSLTLFGASHPELFLTTTTKSVSTDGDCNFYPCYNKPKCINSPQQYSCVTSISVDQVLSIFETRLKLL